MIIGPAGDAVTVTIKLKVSDAMVIAKLEKLSAFYSTYITATVRMHKE